MRSARTVPAIVIVAAVLAAGALSCSRGAPGPNLLAGKPPVRAEGVNNPALITDGRQAGEGEDWNAPTAAVLQSEGAHVVFDLGQIAPIDAAFVQGDNNDDYLVAVSE